MRSSQPNPGGHTQEYPAVSRSSSGPVAPFKLKWTVSQVRREVPDESVMPNPGQSTRRPDDTIIRLKPKVTVPDGPVSEPEAVVGEPDSGSELPDATVMSLDSVESTETEPLEQLEGPKTVAGVYRFGEKVRRLIRAHKGPRKVAMPKGEAVRGSTTWKQRLQFVAARSPREFPLVNWDPG